jgi:hypothetical protein
VKRLWVGLFFFFVWVPILVEMPQMPSPTVLQLWTPSGKDLGQTYMASEQECEEVRAELGSQFRSECIGIGSTVRKRQWRCWSAELAHKAEGADCAPSSVTEKPE